MSFSVTFRLKITKLEVIFFNDLNHIDKKKLFCNRKTFSNVTDYYSISYVEVLETGTFIYIKSIYIRVKKYKYPDPYLSL
jgi:hypothetical protein